MSLSGPQPRQVSKTRKLTPLCRLKTPEPGWCVARERYREAASLANDSLGANRRDTGFD